MSWFKKIFGIKKEDGNQKIDVGTLNEKIREGRNTPSFLLTTQ